MRIVLVKAPGHVDRLFVVDAATPDHVEASLAPDSARSDPAGSDSALVDPDPT